MAAKVPLARASVIQRVAVKEVFWFAMLNKKKYSVNIKALLLLKWLYQLMYSVDSWDHGH